MPRAVRRTRFMEVVWAVHRALYRATGGRLGRRMGTMPVLLLTTTGRRSGRPRTVPLIYLDDDGRWVVIASNAGEPRHPAWWLNLEARPEAQVQIGRETHTVSARAARGEERERLWARLLELEPSYDVYRQRTDREIPVVVLEEPGETVTPPA